MKLVLIISLSILRVTVWCQTPLDSIISVETCSCLNQSDNISFDAFIRCIQTSIVNNEELLTKSAIEAYGDSTYDAGRKYGQIIGERIAVEMIYSCTAYFNLMDQARFASIPLFNKDSIRNEISKLNNKITPTGNSDFFTQRGVLYFQLSDLDNALNDFNEAINLNQFAFQSIYFKAWALELKGNYEEAIALYNKLGKLTHKNEFFITEAIVHRKKNSR